MSSPGRARRQPRPSMPLVDIARAWGSSPRRQPSGSRRSTTASVLVPPTSMPSLYISPQLSSSCIQRCCPAAPRAAPVHEARSSYRSPCSLCVAPRISNSRKKKFEKCEASKQARREGRPTDNKHAAYSVVRVEQNFVFLTLLYSKTEKTRRNAKRALGATRFAEPSASNTRAGFATPYISLRQGCNRYSGRNSAVPPAQCPSRCATSGSTEGQRPARACRTSTRRWARA